jgi:hypothetical protein
MVQGWRQIAVTGALALCAAHCGARSDLRLPVDGETPDGGTPPPDGGLSCGSSGYCTTTTVPYAATFGGLAQGDAICDAEHPGSHFYRASCDAARPFAPAGPWMGGYGEIEAGSCYNCDDWTSESGPYDPQSTTCPEGYATVAALVPQTTPVQWRICEAGDWPLACCIP